jgi:hypothetical protein
VPWIAYSFAAITSWSRVYDEKHWTSDVVLGALIGYVTGKLFTNSLFEEKGILVTPKIGSTMGVNIFVPIGSTKKKKKGPNYLFKEK